MNPYFIAGSVIAVVLAYGAGHWQGDEAGQAKVQQQWDHEKADLMAKHAKEVEKAREKEQNWQQAADNIRQEKDREIRNVNARATALSNSLRSRPSAPSTDASSAAQASGAGQATTGCTGAELYREYAEAFTWEAARADTVRAALKQCYKQYESVN
jgi:N-methylhydantoinase A/oxoprolinase/acetone carboxylase beta subunit